jgi:hypothetical protein
VTFLGLKDKSIATMNDESKAMLNETPAADKSGGKKTSLPKKHFFRQIFLNIFIFSSVYFLNWTVAV